MLNELSANMMQELDAQAEFNPPSVLEQIEHYIESDF